MPGLATVSPGDDVLDDVLGPGLRVVFVGMASGRVSALRRRHYAGPGNKFWPTLAAVGLTPERLTPDREREILRHGMGLTDVQKRQSGSDVEIEVAPRDVALLRAKLARIRPRRIAFNGKRAASHWLGKPTAALCYGPAADPHGVAEELFILPSTSGAASGFWDVRPWADLADRVLRDLPSQTASLSGIS
ncbi:MAG TPA: mismatch-specific DNA-glycosylase [Geminicoccus sp.]|uniref:mismatch-specific DNA-glycosylase n=1 Tax=Geminicoccus sp. TaxID=2024832 RepID=UPI002BF763C7|nr:mismatch-specific DNA-glycosylase [Geminicoccus sp.]HWL69959.1 mismatch-specific DNA-glycosylase [Geminicoccus sp.]